MLCQRLKCLEAFDPVSIPSLFPSGLNCINRKVRLTSDHVDFPAHYDLQIDCCHDATFNCLHGLWNISITIRLTLITTDLLILTRSLLHESLQLSIVVLGDRFGFHLHCTAAVCCLDVFADVDDCLLQSCNTDMLLQTSRCQASQINQHFRRKRYSEKYLHVKRRANKLNLDNVIWGVFGLSSAKCSLDGIDSFVTETSDFHISTDL